MKTTKRRRVLLVVLLLTAAGILFVVWHSFAFPPRFTDADIAKIKLGMTRDEVLEILGPPGGYDGYWVDYDLPGQLARQVPKLMGPQMNGEVWACRAAAVEVCFYDDKVSLIQRPAPKEQQSWPRRLWRRLTRS